MCSELLAATPNVSLAIIVASLKVASQLFNALQRVNINLPIIKIIRVNLTFASCYLSLLQLTAILAFLASFSPC